MTDHADRIITNGRLITFDDAQPQAEALAVRGGEIVAVGTTDDIANLAGPETVVHDAANNTVLPGFIDSHVHLFGGSAELDALDLMNVEGKEALKAAVDVYVANRPDDELIYGVSCDYHMLGRGTPITRQVLDAILPDRAFAIMAHDHHTAWANTRALELAGVLHGGDAGEGSKIVMGNDGLASGELRETGAFGPVLAHTPTGGREMLGYITGDDPDPPATSAQRAADKDIIARDLEHCARQGITTLHNMDGNFYQLELLDELKADGRLLCRTQVPFHLKSFHPLDKLDEADEMRRRFNDDMLWSGRVKMFMDGVIDSHTAFVLRGYPDEPDNTGSPLFSAEHFNEAAMTCDAKGLQISVHAIGDAAVRRTLDGYEAARKTNGARDSRHRIEHIELLHADDLPRLTELGVIASMQPLHSPRSGFFKAPPPGQILHEDQLALAFAWQTIRDTGAVLAFSTDWPVVPVDVMPTIKGACLQVECGRSWGDQHQSLDDTLAAYTRIGAYTEFNEHKKGRLKAGMMADIVVMSHDLHALAPEDLDQAGAVLTMCNGRINHQA
jgi:predicted amidohydrolase YtcJ